MNGPIRRPLTGADREALRRAGMPPADRLPRLIWVVAAFVSAGFGYALGWPLFDINVVFLLTIAVAELVQLNETLKRRG